MLTTRDVLERFKVYLDLCERRCLVDAGERGLEFVEVDPVGSVPVRANVIEGEAYGFWCEGSSGCAEYF